MTIKIQSGVSLTTLSTTKYKTIRVFIRFSGQHTAKTASERTLLTSLLETNTKKYSTQTQLSKKLADLYGASFGINVGKKGNVHQVNVSFQMVNGKYVDDNDLFNEGVDFLHEVLFHPNVGEQSFEEEIFSLEKENLITYLESMSEDKQSFASLKLQEIYFEENPDQQVPSFGTVEGVESITAKSAYQAYTRMLEEDQIAIFVVGDIKEEEVEAAFSKWTFPSGERKVPEIFTPETKTTGLRELTLKEPVTQAKLNLAYQTGIYYEDHRRIPLVIFNGLFGGFAHSKLFMNVREKESLAYYASSSINTFNGVLTVQTGIESTNRARVLQLIEEQLISLQKGEIEDLELEQTKEMVKNQYFLSQDYAQSLVEQSYITQWMPQTAQSEEEFLQAVMAVTKEEVQEIAKSVTLQAIFFLEGESTHGED